jgi:hypothetical protein
MKMAFIILALCVSFTANTWELVSNYKGYGNVQESVERLRVPNGYVYKTVIKTQHNHVAPSVAMCYVPL